MKKAVFYIKRYFEAIIWIVGLALMALSNPLESHHFSLCPIKNSGLGFCPGCGLGHAIGFLVRGEWVLSFKSHPLAIFAIIILTFRIFQIFKDKPLQLNADEQNH